MHYAEIRIDGHLDPQWKEWLGDVSITHSEGCETTLTGFFSDQAALYGVIGKLRDLGVKLISIDIREAPG